MDKKTLSNYGWIVVVTLILAVMLGFATPFGSFIRVAINSTVKGFSDTQVKDFNSGNFNVDDFGLDYAKDQNQNLIGGNDDNKSDDIQPDDTKTPAPCGIEGHYINDSRGEHGILATNCPNSHKYTCECESWVVLDNGTYTMKTEVDGKSVYNGGEKLPKCYVPQKDDTFTYGDYIYTYKHSDHYSYGTEWSAVVIDKTKKSYGNILEYIDNKPVTFLTSTFSGCKSLKESPTIPKTITALNGTYSGCTSFSVTPIIPQSVTSMNGTFFGCTSLTKAPSIPTTCNYISEIFYNCTSLCTYEGSTEPKGYFTKYQLPVGNDNKTQTLGYGAAFRNCDSLIAAPNLPETGKEIDASYMFDECDNIVYAPAKIPEGVYTMSMMFSACYKLNNYNGNKDGVGDFSNYVIPSTCHGMSWTFRQTPIKYAPKIPSTVTGDIRQLFGSCPNLTGTVIMDTNSTNCEYIFTFTKKPIILTGNSNMLNMYARTARDGNVTVRK